MIWVLHECFQLLHVYIPDIINILLLFSSNTFYFLFPYPVLNVCLNFNWGTKLSTKRCFCVIVKPISMVKITFKLIGFMRRCYYFKIKLELIIHFFLTKAD